MNCREFFESVQDDTAYCRALQTHPEHIQIGWEAEPASTASPSPIVSGEVLARQVIDPTHYDTVAKNIAPTFFDDVSSRGASCHRMKHITVEKIKEMAEARVAIVNLDPPKTGIRRAIGFTKLSALEVRNVYPESSPGRRGSAVYDTAKSDDISHADICQLVSGKQEGKSVRAQLFMLAKERLELF
jgi:hypothetical protein